MDPVRLAVLVLWGGGTVYFYGKMLLKRRRSFALHHDRRSRRDLIAGFALFLVAIASALSIGFVLFGQQGTGLRGFAVSVALGAFLAAGIVMAGEDAAAEASEG